MTQPNQTYIHTLEGWMYLAVVIDLYSRKVVGGLMAKHMKVKSVNDTLLMAIWKRKPSKGLLWHTDRGSQYASISHRALLNEYGITQCMTRKGNCWDNAVSESFFHTLKTELVHHQRYKTRAEAKQDIFEYSNFWGRIGSRSQKALIDTSNWPSQKCSKPIVRRMHKFKIKVTKFTLVGAANFALTFIVFTGMLKVLAVNYLLSLVAAWVVGMLFSYVLNFAWVFKPEQKVQFRARFFRFFLASVLSIALNMLALSYIVERTNFDPFYVQMALIPFIVVFNFLTAKLWSLKPLMDNK